jgi:DNA-binding transcriptional regulator YiaG
MPRDEITGAQIRRMRNLLNMTQEELARHLHVTFSTVNRWEGGHAKPSAMATQILQRFAQEREVKL